MFKPYLIISLFILLTSCNNGSTNTPSQHINEEATTMTPSKEKVDSNFKDFIRKFSTDTSFQLSRTKCPLKIKWSDGDNDRDTLIYVDRLNFKMLDFRKQKSTTLYDQWEQKIVVDKNNTSARIETRGIDNGIVVDYLFEKINGAWIIVEVYDSST